MGTLLGILLKYVTPILAGLGAVLAVFAAGKRSEATKVRAENAERTLDHVEKAREVDKEVNSISPDTARDELRDFFSDNKKGD